jgi:DNA-binding CsgD family transcriptional regulator
MPWLEYLVPAVVVIVATSCATLALVYSRYCPSKWSAALFEFLVASSGVSLLTALGIFLKASGIVQSPDLYFALWNCSFVVLGITAWFAIKTGLHAVGCRAIPRTRALFIVWSAVSYALNLQVAIAKRSDLYFPYLGGAYAATSLYLFCSLGIALYIVLRGREELSAENKATLRRFLRVFPPFCSIIFLDELIRTMKPVGLPWPPLLPLAPLLLYVFSGIEIAGRLRNPSPGQGRRAIAERRATRISKSCKAAPLTLREREVLVELMQGNSNSSIAAHMGISASTVKNHVYSIFQKTGAGSRSELFRFADSCPAGADSQDIPARD